MGQQPKEDLARRYSGPRGFLPASSVWARYGVTAMTISRWLADPKLNFPKPFYLGRFRFWQLAELEAWESTRPRTSSMKLADRCVEMAQ